MISFTLMSLVSISPSEASSWCLSTYLWHFDRAFSFGVDTLIELGMIGCITVSRSKFEDGLWSTHFSPPAEWDRLCIGWTGGTVWWPQSENTNQDIIHMWHHFSWSALVWKACGKTHWGGLAWGENKRSAGSHWDMEMCLNTNTLLQIDVI